MVEGGGVGCGQSDDVSPIDRFGDEAGIPPVGIAVGLGSGFELEGSGVAGSAQHEEFS
jgi:hypothetical protein